MRLEGTALKYTKEDLEGLSLYDYSQDEIDEQMEISRGKIGSPNSYAFPIFLLAMGLFILGVLTYKSNETAAVGCFCLIPVLLCAAYFVLTAKNPKQVQYYSQYIRVVVAEKRGIITKTWREKHGSRGSYSMSFYPIMVLDTKSGYRTRIYCFEDEYKNAKEGKRINLKYRRSLQKIGVEEYDARRKAADEQHEQDNEQAF